MADEYKGKYKRMLPPKLSTNSLVSTYILHILKEKDEAMYGQEIALEIKTRTELRDRNNKLILEGYDLSRGVLYGSLRSLEEQGFVEGRWEYVNNKPSNKKTKYFYKITEDGIKALDYMVDNNKQSLLESINMMTKIKEDLIG